MRRIRETAEGVKNEMRAISPDDVAVLYVEDHGGESIVRELKLNKRGELIHDWPGGFFEEGLREVLS
jgi:predicted ATPase